MESCISFSVEGAEILLSKQVSIGEGQDMQRFSHFATICQEPIVPTPSFSSSGTSARRDSSTAVCRAPIGLRFGVHMGNVESCCSSPRFLEYGSTVLRVLFPQ